MSTDFAFQCHTCRRELHAGQCMAMTRYSWGYGSNDEAGRRFVAEWAMKHASEGHDVRLVVSDDLPDGWIMEHETDGELEVEPLAAKEVTACTATEMIQGPVVRDAWINFMIGRK